MESGAAHRARGDLICTTCRISVGCDAESICPKTLSAAFKNVYGRISADKYKWRLM